MCHSYRGAKTHTLRQVAGRQIGRVQYFLNRELKHLLDCGKMYPIEGTISGKPTTTKTTLVHQTWRIYPLCVGSKVQ
ncbi:hypothetical protein ACROYT_G014889 [Oculina patagonica]